MVAGSFLLQMGANLAMTLLNYEATPEIIHDKDPSKNDRHSRHNKALMSLHSARHFLVFCLMCVAFQLIFGSAKGDFIEIIFLFWYLC